MENPIFANFVHAKKFLPLHDWFFLCDQLSVWRKFSMEILAKFYIIMYNQSLLIPEREVLFLLGFGKQVD